MNDLAWCLDKIAITVHGTYCNDEYNLWTRNTMPLWTPEMFFVNCDTKPTINPFFTIWTLNRLTPWKLRHLVGKSSSYTDIVFVAFPLLLLCMLQSMGSILKWLMRCLHNPGTHVEVELARWMSTAKWCVNAMAKKPQSLPPTCICTSIKWTEIFCSLVASYEFDTLGWVIVCNTGCQIFHFWVLTTNCRDCKYEPNIAYPGGLRFTGEVIVI